MSVTFFCPEAPTQIVTPYVDEPEFTYVSSVLPEVILSNCNARAVLELMDLPAEELVGEVIADELPALEKRLEAAIADSNHRAAFIEPVTVDEQPVATKSDFNALYYERMNVRRTGPLCISGGRSDEYLRETCTRLLGLVQQARQNRFRVSWS